MEKATHHHPLDDPASEKCTCRKAPFMRFSPSISNADRTAGLALFFLLSIAMALGHASTWDTSAQQVNAINWSGITLVPANDAPAGSELLIRPPSGASLPQVAVQLAGQNLQVISGSPQEVRVRLPARPVTGQLTMINLSARTTGTLASEYRVVAARPAPAPAPMTAPRTLTAGSLAGESQNFSSNAYLSIQAGGEDAPVLFGEDNTQAYQGNTDVSAWLECIEFSVALDSGQQGVHGSSQSTGHRVWRPARFLLRAGKSTPWLFHAGRTNKNIDLTLYFFNRHHETGVVEQNFQYRIQQGRIVEVRLVKPGTADPAATGLPYYVELLVVPNVSVIMSITGGTEMIDDWAANYGL